MEMLYAYATSILTLSMHAIRCRVCTCVIYKNRQRSNPHKLLVYLPFNFIQVCTGIPLILDSFPGSILIVSGSFLWKFYEVYFSGPYMTRNFVYFPVSHSHSHPVYIHIIYTYHHFLTGIMHALVVAFSHQRLTVCILPDHSALHTRVMTEACFSQLENFLFL